MNTPRPYRRIGLFAIGLLLVFGAGAAIGSLFEPADTESDSSHGAEHGSAHGESGYALRMSPAQMGERGELRFTIDGPAGTVTDFDELHERRMHLIVVRRDGAEFQHLHPEMDGAGNWTMPIEFDQPGVYRAFADFSVGGEQRTLSSDFSVAGGEFEMNPFPPARPIDSTNGYEVRLRTGKPVAGESASLTFAVSKGGHGVPDLAPYLGAKGHLVALRDDDLAFLHVHPEEAAAAGSEAAGGHAHAHSGHGGGGAAANEIAFAATFPTAGRYRLYLQFKHDGAVQTVEYTVEVPR